MNLPNSKPQKLSASDAFLGTTVALSDEFAAVGQLYKDIWHDSYPNAKSKMLIRSLQNGSTVVVDGDGRLSLDRNILARFSSANSFVIKPNTLEVFRLDDDATPVLIDKIVDDNLSRAFVQNNSLITVRRTESGKKLCIEQIN